MRGYNERLEICATHPSHYRGAYYAGFLAFGLGKRWLSLIFERRSADGSVIQILARGNFSLQSVGLVNFLVALGAVTLGLAGILAWQGYWPILLIAIVQLALVSLILVRTWQQAWVQEQIDVDETVIRVKHQRHKHFRQYELETAWAVVEIIHPSVAWYGPGIRLRSGREAVEIGTFLTSDEKQRLADCLNAAIERHSALRGAINF